MKDAMTGRRVPIRRRVFIAIISITFAILAVAVVTSILSMNRMMHEAENMLSEELSRSLLREVEQKASKTDVMFNAYAGYMELLRIYTENMYKNPDELVASGKYVDAPRPETPEGEYAMQSAFAHADPDLDSYMNEIFFFSHLESILEPVVKKNEEQITTSYMGTKSGLIISYDKWSYLSAVPEPEVMIYDYTQSEWYRKGMEADRVIFTSLYIDAMGRGLTVTIATPFTDLSGETQGVLAADFDITGIYDEMISMDLGEGSSSFAFNENNEIIGFDSENVTFLQNHLNLESDQIAQMKSGKAGIFETKDAFYAYAPIEKMNWTLCAMVPRTILMEKVDVLEKSFTGAMVIFILFSIVLLLAGLFFSTRVSKSITYPVELLSDDIQIIANGDLEHKAVAYRNDEIGDVTVRLNEMVERLKGTINDLVSAQKRADEMHELANRDALTSVKSRTAYAGYIKAIQDEMDEGKPVEFALGVFDCDNLKTVNDQYGHDKGDEYLKTASHLICRVFKCSPVFRIGGDEFAVGLQGEDFCRRDELVDEFMTAQKEICAAAQNQWEKVRVALGIAVYDPKIDSSAYDTMRRADKIMYENKASEKKRSEQKESKQ